MNFNWADRYRGIAFAMSLFMLLGIGAAPASAALKQAPGSRITMDVPDSFEISKLFSGFIMPAAGLSVVIAELPTTRYDQIVRGFTDTALGKKGITGVKRGQLKRTDKHLYLTGTQKNRGREFSKYVLLIRDAKSVAVITINIPPASLPAGYVKLNEIITALTSAKFTAEPAPIIKQFTLTKLGPFKEAGKLMGSAILYTTDGQLAPKKRGESRNMVIIAPSVDRVAIGETAGFSKRALGKLGGYRDIKINAEEAVEIGGLKGTNLNATAVQTSENVAVDIRQIVLARNGGGYFRMLAIINSSQASSLLAPAEELMGSFQPKP